MHWYLIYTHCCHEKKVKKRLERERFETFLPVTDRWSLRKDRQERVSLPLFPGYLFVRTEMNADTYLKILRIQGVIGFCCSVGRPAVVPDEEMENILRSLRNGKDIKTCNSIENIRAYMAVNRISQASNL